MALWVSALAGAKGKRLTDFMAGDLVAGVEALAAEASKPTAGIAEARRTAAVIKAAMAQHAARQKAAKAKKKGR